ncbi:MAG: CbiX/SirB N-terminal domain-containing protein [Gammaproteobacteria bacterium]
MAHGSRRTSSNEEVRRLTEKMTSEAQGHFDAVRCAFLELAEPSIPDGLRTLIKDGFSDIIVVPYFLSAGRHVAEDIPGEVAIITADYPDVMIRIAPYLGMAQGVTRLLLDQAARNS